MLRSANGFHRFALLLLVLAGLPVRAAVAQGLPLRPWTITADFTGLRIGGSSGWVYGPELGIRRDFGPRWGLELTASLPVLDTEQYADNGAAALDLGPTFTLANNKGELGFSAGATAFLVGDASELVDGGIGGFFGGHGTAWLTPSLGAVVAAKVRVSGQGSAYPSLSLGLAVRF
jgi:hypothetical protein